MRALWFAAYKIVRHLPPPFPFNLLPYCLDVLKKLPPYRLDLLQHLLVGQQAFSHQYPPYGPEQFLEGDDLLWIEFFGHGYFHSIECRVKHHERRVAPDALRKKQTQTP